MRINHQSAVNRRDEFGVGGNAGPAARNFPGLGVDIIQADGFHFVHAPGDGLGGFGRAGNAGADVVTEFFEIFVGVRLDGAGAGNGGERF